MSEARASERSISPVLIAGATATGKSAVAQALAREIGGEIVSVDSMQVYRGLDIGTAKPSVAERELVTHHLVDIFELDQSFDVAAFVLHATRAIKEIQSRGKVPILCGGTGLYFSGLLQGLGESPPADPALRRELEKLTQPELLAELAQADPQTFAVIDQMNRRRVVRAVEVMRLTGKPFSQQRGAWSENQTANESWKRAFFLSRHRHELHKRFEQRVDRMFEAGLVEETRELIKRGLEQNRNAMQALGYRQVVEHLRGQRSLAETIELIKIRTRQFAKRQETWFKKYFHGEHILVTGANESSAVARIRQVIS